MARRAPRLVFLPRLPGLPGRLVLLVLLALLVFLVVLVGPSPSAQAPATQVRILDARVLVRATADTQSAPLGAVEYGQVLPLLGTSGAWAHVTVFFDTTRIDAFIPAASVAPAPEGAPVSAALTREGAFDLPQRGAGAAVALDAGGSTRWITAVPTRAVPVVDPPPDLGALAQSPALLAALDGGTVLPANKTAEVGWCWLLRSTDISVVSPAEPALTIIYNDVPGLPPGDALPVIVRLLPAGPRWRLVDVARGRADAPLRSESDWSIAAALRQATVPDLVPEGALGLMKTRLVHRLSPGDYAVVLRPTGARPTAGDRVFGISGRQAGEAVLYGQVWPFRVS